MTDASEKTDLQNRWKERYYDTLEDLENKEKSWREVERLLRQLVSRLTLAADNRYTLLTQQLKELRNAVREGRDFLQLRDLIENISESVTELERLRKKNDEYPHPAFIFTQIFEQISIPSQHSRTFRQLKKKAKKLDASSDPDILNEEFVELLKEIADPLVIEKKKQRKTTILDRLLSRQKEENEGGTAEAATESKSSKPDGAEARRLPKKLVAPAVGDLLLQLSLRLPDVVKRRINFPALKKYTNRARARKDLITIVDVIAQQIEAAYNNDEPATIILDDESVKALGDSIKHFVSSLQVPTDLQGRMYELEEYYSDHSDDVESLIHCINSLTDIVADICGRLTNQHDELESFFIQLDTRLQDLDLGLNKTAELNALGSSNSQQLDRAVQEDMDGLNESIQKVDEIGPLKESIKKHMDSIARHLQHYQDTESARLKESEEDIKKLTEKIAKMEEDSEHLRSRLEKTEQQSFKDVLTGLPNRNAYEFRLAEEIARSRRYNSFLCMVVWDIDDFESINESYGHAAGDRILKVIAEKLKIGIRETDFFARFGGEEFILLLPGTSLESARLVAEKLRETIAATPFHFRDTGVAVTISGGIAQLTKDETSSSLFERADKALYEAKEKGCNSTVVAE